MRDCHPPAGNGRPADAVLSDEGAASVVLSLDEAPPDLPAGSPGRPERSRYLEQYGVVIVCPDETAQRAVYEGLRALPGCKLRVVVT